MKLLAAAVLVMTLSGCSQSQPSVSEYALRNDSGQAAARMRVEEGLQKIEDTETAERDRKECSVWTYAEKQARADLAKMRSASQEEWGRICYQFSCSYQGEVQVDGEKKSLNANAGGWISITDKGGTQYFVSDEQLPGFLAWCNCCE